MFTSVIDLGCKFSVFISIVEGKKPPFKTFQRRRAEGKMHLLKGLKLFHFLEKKKKTNKHTEGQDCSHQVMPSGYELCSQNRRFCQSWSCTCTPECGATESMFPGVLPPCPHHAAEHAAPHHTLALISFLYPFMITWTCISSQKIILYWQTGNENLLCLWQSCKIHPSEDFFCYVSASFVYRWLYFVITNQEGFFCTTVPQGCVLRCAF